MRSGLCLTAWSFSYANNRAAHTTQMFWFLLILPLRFTPYFWRLGRQRVGVLLFNMRVRVRGNLLVSLASALGSSPRPAIQKKEKGE